MRAKEFLKLIKEQADFDSLQNLKSVISNKIIELEPTEENLKMLGEIEDLLDNSGAGGKLGLINNKLSLINDPSVKKAQKLLAKYIASIPMTKEQREDLFDRWENDELVDREKLLLPGKKSITDVIAGYETNPAIKELTDDLAQVSAVGQGKGEFLLSVFSKGIYKLQKGDLQIDDMKIEVKTFDQGGGRLFDQDVRPAKNFDSAVENFRNSWSDEIAKAFAKVPATGLKLVDLITLSDFVDPQKENLYYSDVESVLSSIFPGIDIGKILNGLQMGNIGVAKQAYALANLEFYKSVKKDDGYLFLDLNTSPVSMVFFQNPEDLAAGGLRLHADTVYVITKDARMAYPQMRIIASKSAASTETPTPVKDKTNPRPAPKVAAQPTPAANQPSLNQPNLNQTNIPSTPQNFNQDTVNS